MKITLPPPRTLQRRVIDALFESGACTAENELMAAHGMDGLAPTKWRQGPYRGLLSAGLIEPCGTGFNNMRYYQLTRPCLELLQAENGQQQPTAGSSPTVPHLVPPRTAPAFRPLDPAYYSRLPQRAGAFDYRSIPSLYASNSAERETAL